MKKNHLHLIPIVLGVSLTHSMNVLAEPELPDFAQLSSEAMRKSDNLRIINGKDAEESAYPFMTGLVNYSEEQVRPFCGASYIGGRYVLTASHCLEGDNSDLGVWIGGHDLDNPQGGQKYKAVRVYLHEQYDSPTVNNDVAIIELAEEVTGVTPIKLLTPQMEADLENGFEFTVMGWGDTGENDPNRGNVTILQEVNVPLYSREQCATDYSVIDIDITDAMLCAGFQEGGKDSCQGDSGGPLVFQQNDEWYQAGIVSFGEGCALPNFTGVYARVSQFNDWINAKMAGVSYLQSTRQGYVEQAFEETVSFEIKNVSDAEFSVTGVEVVDSTNLTPVTIAQNGCENSPLAVGASCEFVLNVKADQAGEGGFAINVSTNNPGNQQAQLFFSMNALEQESLDVAGSTGSPDGITWWGGGTARWVVQTDKVDSGDSAIASGNLVDFENSVLLATTNNERATRLSLKYLVSSEEGYDILAITHNNVSQLRASGVSQTAYEDLSLDLPAGKNRIVIEYSKDSTDIDPTGDDKAYIDTIALEVINSAPLAAVAQSEISANSGETVSLDASASSDPDMDSLTFKWSQAEGETPAVAISNDTSAQASFTAPVASNDTKLNFIVTVTDSAGATSTRQVEVTVKNAPPVAAVAQAAITAQSGTTVTLDASSSTDPENDSLSYQWTQVGGSSVQVTISNNTSAQASFTAPTVNSDTTINLQVTVTDAAGNSNSTQVTATIQPEPKSSGGSTGAILLFMLSLMALRRCKSTSNGN